MNQPGFHGICCTVTHPGTFPRWTQPWKNITRFFSVPALIFSREVLTCLSRVFVGEKSLKCILKCLRMYIFICFPPQSLEVCLFSIKDLRSTVEWVTTHHEQIRSSRFSWVYKIPYHVFQWPISYQRYRLKPQKTDEAKQMTKRLMVDCCRGFLHQGYWVPHGILSNYSSEVLWKTTESRWWIGDSKHQTIFLNKNPAMLQPSKGNQRGDWMKSLEMDFLNFHTKDEFHEIHATQCEKKHLFFV